MVCPLWISITPFSSNVKRKRLIELFCNYYTFFMFFVPNHRVWCYSGVLYDWVRNGRSVVRNSLVLGEFAPLLGTPEVETQVSFTTNVGSCCLISNSHIYVQKKIN